MSTLFVGLDMALKSAAVCVLLPDGAEPIKRLRIPNNPEGMAILIQKIEPLVQTHGITQIHIGMEATGMLGWHLSRALATHPQLAALSPQVYLLNARLVHNFKKAYPEEGKNDDRDAFVIADRLRFGRLPAAAIPEEQYLALQKLTRHRFHLVRTLAAEKNRFLANLFLKFSGFRQEEPLSDPFGAASGELLTQFLSVEEIAQKSVEQLADFLREHGKNRFPDPEAVARALQQAARNSYRLPSCLCDPLNVILAMTLANIRFFEAQIQTLDKTIATQLAAFPFAVALRSVPGLGPVFTAGILAEVGHVERFDSDSALAKFAALCWKEHQSGEFRGDDTPILHSGNAYLRYYLVEAANSLRVHNEEYRAYYQGKHRETKTHAHKRACVLTARKLVRLVYHLLRTGQLYQPPQERKERNAADPKPPSTAPGEIARHIQRRRHAAAGHA